jgi:hypothetical protein
MNLESQLLNIRQHIQEHRDNLKSEEATKSALVIPFLRALGYDVTNPNHVTPELVADIGDRKGERVDYGLGPRDNEAIIVECKRCDIAMTPANHDRYFAQVRRYFHVKKNVKFAILTNGIICEFYSDIDDLNIMDKTPFYTIDLTLAPTARDIAVLSLFEREKFSLPFAYESAGKMLQKVRVKAYLYAETTSPSEEFSAFVGSQVHKDKGRFTSNVKSTYQELVPEAMAEIMEERIKANREDAKREMGPQPSGTKQHVIDGYNIIRAITAPYVEPDRIVMRENQSYCAVLLDDNARKTIIRLYFNNPARLSLGLMKDKEETRLPISKLQDIFQSHEQIIARLSEIDVSLFMANDPYGCDN